MEVSGTISVLAYEGRVLIVLEPAVAGKNATSASPTYQNWRGVHSQARSSNAGSSGHQTPTQSDRNFLWAPVRPAPFDLGNAGIGQFQEDSTSQAESSRLTTAIRNRRVRER